MPKLVEYQCPECSGVFEFMHHPVDEPPPDYCPLCSAYVGDGESPLQKQPVLAVSIATAKNKVPDNVYRSLEESSASRARMAAEMTGADVSEMSAIKVTNLKDNTREGDTHFIPTTPSAAMQGLSVPGTSIAPQNAAVSVEQRNAYAGAAGSGNHAHIALELRRTMPNHELAAAATAKGNMGRY